MSVIHTSSSSRSASGANILHPSTVSCRFIPWATTRRRSIARRRFCDSARRVPTSRTHPPASRASRSSSRFVGSIFILSVHHRKFLVGGNVAAAYDAYPERLVYARLGDLGFYRKILSLRRPVDLPERVLHVPDDQGGFDQCVVSDDQHGAPPLPGGKFRHDLPHQMKQQRGVLTAGVGDYPRMAVPLRVFLPDHAPARPRGGRAGSRERRPGSRTRSSREPPQRRHGFPDQPSRAVDFPGRRETPETEPDRRKGAVRNRSRGPGERATVRRRPRCRRSPRKRRLRREPSSAIPAWTPAKATLRMPGTRLSGSPFISAPSIRSRRARRRRSRARTRLASTSRRLRTMAAAPAHARDLMRGNGAGAQSGFVPAPVNLRNHLGHKRPSDAQGAHSLRPVYLVRADRYKVGDRGDVVHGKPPRPLDRVHVQQRSALAHRPPQRGDVGDGSRLVVDVHKGHDDGIRPKRPGETVRRHVPRTVGLDAAYRESPRLEPGDRIQSGPVLQGRRDDVAAAVPAG